MGLQVAQGTKEGRLMEKPKWVEIMIEVRLLDLGFQVEQGTKEGLWMEKP